MKAWRRYNGTFWKENGPAIDRFFDWVEWDTGTAFIAGRLRMIARARKIMRARNVWMV